METPTDMQRLLTAYEAVRVAPNDPEDTMLLRLTGEGVCLVMLGVTLATQMFTELGPLALPYIQQIAEVAQAQGLLDFTEEQLRDMGIEGLPD